MSSSCHLFGTPCRLIRTARLPCCSLFCPHPFHLHFPALALRRFNQETAPIHTALEVTIWTTGKRFCKPTFDARVIANILPRSSSIYLTKCRRWGSRAHQHRETRGKRGWKNRQHNSKADNCKQAVDYELLCSCGYSTEFHGWAAKTADIGTSIW